MSERERAMRELADELMFQVEKRGSRYTLMRDSDVTDPVRRDRLTLKEAEEMLANWKLRGFHGG